MDLEELKAAVKQAAEEAVGARLDEFENRLSTVETRNEQLEAVKQRLDELANSELGASKALTPTDEDPRVPASKGQDRRRDGWGRRLRSAS